MQEDDAMGATSSATVVDVWFDPVCPTAAVTRYGREVLAGFSTAFGEVVFDVWRRPSAAEHHEAVLLAGCSEFSELERTRVRPPVVTSGGPR